MYIRKDQYFTLAICSVLRCRIQVINNATSAAPAPRNPHSAFSTTVAKPALGPSFAFLTDATIWLSQHREKAGTNEDCTTYVAEIFRSKTAVGLPLFYNVAVNIHIVPKRSRTWCAFRICDGVLCDA